MGIENRPFLDGAQPPAPPPLQSSTSRRRGIVRAIGLGLITGAADDDPSAIGTYASAGAKFGPSFLWTAPVTLPMMVAVVYLSSKLGMVSGEGLFAVIRRHRSRPFLVTVLAGVLIGNVIEAGADIGGMAAALNLLIPIPIRGLVVATGLLILALQIWGSYTFIRNVFRVLSLALLAYVGSAVLAHPGIGQVLRGTFVPTIRFNKDFLEIIVAVIGTTLSAYLYTWQSNEEVEEKIAAGRRRLDQRKGASKAELKQSMWDIIFGMFFSNTVMYFIILSTAATLFKVGKTDINSASDAAAALRPLAGNAAGLLFALGVIGVGFLAVPVMTTGAAYDLCQSVGWKHGLYRKPAEAKKFYIAITIFTFIAIGINFFGVNPMKALVLAGIVQGFSTPPLMLLIMRMTNSRAIMGNRVNGRAINILGWITTTAIFAASAGLVISWFV
ncbi:MAG TPA: Nramp family divalent metal transporter [Bryobacteraceae bacterium]|jgi:NRAMP (natural resistance-associated macrophage protein)-like metal ion transporter|nr:Nramp family divalent metal transporter [Bryobacteraceae bacterium]